MRDILRNKWFKFGIVIVIYLLWVYWVGSWWLLLLVPVIFDIYITKKVEEKRGKETDKGGGMDGCVDFCRGGCDADSYVFLRSLYDPYFFYGEKYAGRRLFVCQ